MALHWLLALMILGSLGVGLYMTGLPFSPQRLQLYNWHKWAGVTILVLSALRLSWRMTHRPPAAPPMPAWQQRASNMAHVAPSALFFAVVSHASCQVMRSQFGYSPRGVVLFMG